MKNSSIHFLLETVRAFPEKVCIADEYDQVSFIDFFTRAYALAKRLSKDKAINLPVLVHMPKSIDAIVSFAAILLSGNFYVPLDIKSPIARMEKIMRDIGPCRVLARKDGLVQIRKMGIPEDKIVCLEDNLSNAINIGIDTMVEDCIERTKDIIDTDPCYVMFTSGSTGNPKGVVISHRGVVDYIEWAMSFFHVDHSDVIGNQAPLHFDNSTLDVYLNWSTGATLNLIPDSLFMFPVKLIDYLKKNKVTFVFFVPSVLNSVAQMGVLSPGRLPDLKKVVFAGEVMPTKHLGYWQSMLPDKLYVNLYGPTEITVDCTYFVVDKIYGPEESLPIGYPCNNSGVLILNDSNQLAASGEQGELCVRGSSLALGYWNDDEKTSQVFTQNPLQSHYFDRIYRTGDIVVRNEKGPILFIGRRDSQIKHMGFRIELGEVERAAESVHGISKCCVLYNHASREITLFYESEVEIPRDFLVRELSARIPAYMMPRKFYHYEKMPLNPNGKIDRKTLSNALG